jgi:hypothetical protein
MLVLFVVTVLQYKVQLLLFVFKFTLFSTEVDMVEWLCASLTDLEVMCQPFGKTA